MNPEVQLVLGCFLLGLVVTYMWWVAIRVDFLRFNLIRIRDNLDSAISAKNQQDNPGYQQGRSLINFLIEEADNWYPSESAFQSSIARLHVLVERQLQSSAPAGDYERLAEVQEALFMAVLRVIFHIGLGHLRGWWFIARAVFSTLAGGSSMRVFLRSFLRLMEDLKSMRLLNSSGARRSIPST